jgi:hypothetical protein
VQQQGWGKCGEAFMADFCHKSCGRCASPDRGPFFILRRVFLAPASGVASA